MKITTRLFLFALFYCTTSTFTFAQAYERSGITFDYTTANGAWTAYEHVISDYYKAFPFITDTGNISPKKRGFSIGVVTVKHKVILGLHVGSIRSIAWGDGDSPMGGRWAEVILVKSNTTDLFAGYFLIYKTWFRMGITGGISYNVMKMKSERSDEKFDKVKEGKFIYLNPGNARNRENTLFFAAKVGLPIAIGRNHALCIEPFYSFPLWKINTSEIRNEMIPNSTPAHEKSYYKSTIPYGGVRFSWCIGYSS